MHEYNPRFGDSFADVRRVWGIYEVQDEAMAAPSNKVFRVVLRSGPSGVAQRLAVIRLFAGVDDPPAGLFPNVVLVVGCIPDKQILEDLDHSNSSDHSANRAWEFSVPS